MNILVVVQARLGSTRLPGKVLKLATGRPVLELMLQRVLAARTPFRLVVATTDSPDDEPIRRLCARLNVDCFSGDQFDLLDRHYQCARERGAEVVVKIPSDCPLIDPDVIDLVLSHFVQHSGEFDFVSNLHPATFPDGNDVELMTFASLERAWRNASKQYEREHTTPYIWDHPELFRISNVVMPGGHNYSESHRWVLDYEEDYRFIGEVFKHLGPVKGKAFTLNDILRLLDDVPELAHINARYQGYNWYRNHIHELRTIEKPGRVA